MGEEGGGGEEGKGVKRYTLSIYTPDEQVAHYNILTHSPG